MRVGFPAHRHAQGLQVQRGHLVDEVAPVTPRHPALRGNVRGRGALGHQELAQPRPVRHLVIKRLLRHVHHGKEDEPQRGCPVRHGDDR